VVIGIFRQPNHPLSGNRQVHWESIQADVVLAGDERLELHAALESGNNVAGYLETDPAEFFTDGEKALSYVTKFKGTLTPEQMSDDLEFSAASHDERCRKHVVKF